MSDTNPSTGYRRIHFHRFSTMQKHRLPCYPQTSNRWTENRHLSLRKPWTLGSFPVVGAFRGVRGAVDRQNFCGIMIPQTYFPHKCLLGLSVAIREIPTAPKSSRKNSGSVTNIFHGFKGGIDDFARKRSGCHFFKLAAKHDVRAYQKLNKKFIFL